MKQALRSYSHVLQLRSEAIRSQLDSFDAAYALKLLVIVGLIAGLGVLVGIPNALQELTLPEQIDQAVSAARTTTAEMAAVVMPAIDEGRDRPRRPLSPSCRSRWPGDRTDQQRGGRALQQG